MTVHKCKDDAEEAKLAIQDCSSIILTQEMTRKFRGIPAQHNNSAKPMSILCIYSTLYYVCSSPLTLMLK